MGKHHISDPLEIEVAKILDEVGVLYIHESQRKGNGPALDFYLPDHDLYIEVKQYHADRSSRQLSMADNVILIQGSGSIKFLKGLKNRNNHTT